LLADNATLNTKFIEGLAAEIVDDGDNNQHSADDLLLSTIAALPNSELTGFAIRLVFTHLTAAPCKCAIDLLAAATASFAHPSENPRKQTNRRRRRRTAPKSQQNKEHARKAIIAKVEVGVQIDSHIC
jgi:hypothetical protein